MKGGVGEGGYDGGEPYSGGHSFGRRIFFLDFWEEAFWRGTRVLVSWLVFFLVLWESSADCEYHCRGHQVARGFRHGG